MEDPAKGKIASVEEGAIAAVMRSNWDTTRVVLPAGAMPLARTKRKYSNSARKTIMPMVTVKYHPPRRIAPKATAIATIALIIRVQDI